MSKTIKKYKLITIIAIVFLVLAFGIILNLVSYNFPILDNNSKQIGDNKTSSSDHNQTKMYDDFSSGPYHLTPGTLSPNGKWLGVWDGGGSLDVKQDPYDTKNYLLGVESGSVLNETRSGLVLTTGEYKDFVLSLDVRNDKQLREPNPNSWEVGWIFWRYMDNTHFNYFTLKPTGSESGKYDGGVNPTDQLYIQATEFPSVSIGKWDHLDITVKGKHVTIEVNGILAQEFDDVTSFDKGKIGLYCEDASVSFDNISITPI